MATTERPTTAVQAEPVPLGRVRENVLIAMVVALLCGASARGEWGLVLAGLVIGVLVAAVTYISGALRR